MRKESLLLNPIGIIATPHRSKYEAPRQPASAKVRTIGTITLNPGENFEQALEDLAGFEFVWVLFWFHQNSTWKPKVLPPHSGRRKRGLFSTRSPHRPNPIGLSLCRILAVRGRTVQIENPDMLNGTPILDLKPYVPHAESRPEARNGWIGERNEMSRPAYSLQMAPDAEKAISRLTPRDRAALLPYLEGVLSHDPHPHPYRRITLLSDEQSILAVKHWRVWFTVSASSVLVTKISRTRDGKKGTR